MLDAEYIRDIANSPVICVINTVPYWREVLEILADEDIWVDYVLSGISISPGPDYEGVVEHTLLCYDERDWEGYAIVNHVLDQDKVSSVFGPWHMLDDLQVYDKHEYNDLMEKRIKVYNNKRKERARLKKTGKWFDPYVPVDMTV